jgi:ABC-type nickel/cobalt efflux system permease component RcnA
MVSLSFLYGVFHAAGPGHGKVVISTYLTTHESRLTRGLLLTVLSSLTQGLTAIVAVGATVWLLDWTMRDTHGTALTLETGSYGLVVLLGLVLCIRSGLRLWRRRQCRRHRDHSEVCGCGHAYVPDVALLNATASPVHLFMTVISIGIRPCSGAVLVLLLAVSMGQIGAGVASVMAMAVGTTITVSALAVVSVHARRLALGLAGLLRQSERGFSKLLDGVALVGGLVLITVGSSLLLASWQVTKHPLL